MAQSVAVVRATLTATLSASTAFESAGFGAPTAAIVILCNATSAANPVDTGSISVGFWDGTNQAVSSVTANDAKATTDTLRFANDAYIAAMQSSSGTTLFAYSASAATNGINLTLDIDNTAGQRYCTVILIKGVSAKVVTHTPGATNGTTGESPSIGFAPKAVIAAGVGASADIAGTIASFSFGIARQSDGDHRMLTWYSTNGATDTAVYQLFSETELAGQVSSSVDWSAAITTWGSDTFTTTTTGATSGDIFYALALGADVAIDIGTLTTSTSTSVNQDITTTNNPDAVLIALGTTDTTGTLVSDSKANGLMIGLANSSANYSHNIYDEDAAATSNSGSVASAADGVNLDSSASGTRSDLITGTVALSTAKFTIDYSVADATARKGWWVSFGPAASSLPTLSASTYKPGTLTTSGWQPRVTAS